MRKQYLLEHQKLRDVTSPPQCIRTQPFSNLSEFFYHI